MPQTTLVASSCATAVPPASITRRVPASPSCPMPVSIATSTRPSHAAAALRSIGSTEGRQKFSGGSSDSRACSPPAVRFDQQVAVARGQIDPARPAAPRHAAPRRRAGRRSLLMCSARIGVKVRGMCWVSTTGTDSVSPRPCTSVNSACGPPVELPIASSRGGSAGGRPQRQRRAPAAPRAAAAPQRRRSRARPFTFSISSRRNVSSPPAPIELGFGT